MSTKILNKNLKKALRPRAKRKRAIRSSLYWRPHTAQQEILAAARKYRYLVLVCGRRFGKTELCVNKLIRDAWENPGDYVYIAPSLKQAKRIAWRKLKRFFPDSFKDPYQWKNESELWVQNKRGGRILLLGADQPDSLRGEGWKGVILDETADIKPYTYISIRPALADYKGYIWFIGTPKGHNHFYEWFIKDKKYHDPNYRDINDNPVRIQKSVKSFNFPTSSNPHIAPEEIDAAREDMSAEEFEQEFNASFENYSGLVYKEFMQNRNQMILKTIYDKQGNVIGAVREEKTVMFKSYYHYYFGLDTGKYTGGILKAIDDQGDEYIINEIYNIDGIVKEIATEIKKKLYRKNLIGKTIDSASQVKKEYENNGLYFISSKKDVGLSIQIVRRKQKAGTWFILDNCKAAIREFSSRKWPEKMKNGNQTGPAKENDHTVNAEDYIQMTFLRTEQKKEYWKKKIKSPDQLKREKQLFAQTIKKTDYVKLDDRG